jgi:hypothetical protein
MNLSVHRENEERKVNITELTRAGSGIGLGDQNGSERRGKKSRRLLNTWEEGASFHSRSLSPFITVCQVTRDVPDDDAQPSAESLTHRPWTIARYSNRVG